MLCDSERTPFTFPFLSISLWVQCDAAGARILQRYASIRQFGRLVKSINQKKGITGVPNAAAIDPREVRT